MAKINIQFTLFSAFYSPLISTFSAGFLQEEGLEPEWSVSPPGVSAIVAIEDGSVHVAQSALSQGFGPLGKGEEPSVVHFAQINEMDGFFITGDLGRIDEDGYVHIVGRDKDLIISGGYNIYPKEIELLLDEQPGVLESAVIGVPHPDFGETVVGVLVAEPGESPDLEAIEAAAQQSLARFKHPRKLVVVESLPRNTMGKVQKNLLRDSYKDMFAG